MTIVNTVVIVRDQMGGSDTATALAFAAAGAGSMVAALALPRLLEHLDDRPVMVSGGFLLTAGLLAGLLQPGFTALLILWFVLGAGSSMIQTPAGRLLRRSSNQGDRSALFSAQFALSHLCWLVLYPLAGWGSAWLGIGSTFALLAAISLVATVSALFLWPAGDPRVVPHEHKATDHGHLHTHDEHHNHDHEGWEGPEPHSHPHRHRPVRHSHAFVVDLHHPAWPRG